MENYLRNHSEDRVEKIKEIGQELIELDFMKDNIDGEIKTVLTRWNQVQHQVSSLTIFNSASIIYIS